MRVLAAMSGGVDSSVAALLLQRQGHEVVSVFMRNGVSGTSAQEKSCCSASDARDAAVVADRLGMAFYAVDYQQEFAALMDHFAAEYRAGRTPNPCVLCNQQLKFGHLFSLADDIGADAVATGHYAQVADGRLLRAVDANKDQTYYLFGIERAALSRTLFPLGGLQKAEVRRLAAEAGLVTADKPESMEICFVTSGDYRDVVRARGGGGRPGRFVDAEGRPLGEHDGVDGFTVGQRKGLPALGRPHYVAAIDAGSGDVVLVPRDGLSRTRMFVGAVNWLVDPPADGAELALEVKVRARHEAVAATVVARGDGPGDGGAQRAEVRFAAPVEAITPGQAAVFYRGELVVGGGFIDGSA
ncbi:MAG: tRNA 2-thiouridine(34) synthase MnmA [Planctomycetes bacterium]|nr:tRNA 2-thiouridine(34) synthase MnmA [Planctomycetota bacterium]